MADTDVDPTGEEPPANDHAADKPGDSTSGSLLRRRLVQVFGGLGVASFAGAMLAPLKNLGIAAGGGGGELVGQTLVLAAAYTPPDGSGTADVGSPVTADLLSVPGSVLAYPENHKNENNYLVRLHRLEPDRIGEPTIEDMTAEGHVAYSAVCTHLGCTVEWDDDGQTATGNPTNHCNCHGSQFDPYSGAEVVNPPADRPLPQIGVAIEDGTLTLSSDFEARVGP